MPGISYSAFGNWDGQLLASLPQTTIPDTATGIARADVNYESYAPTNLHIDPITPAAVQKQPSFWNSLLGDVSKVLGATGININASGQGVSVVQAAQQPRTLVNTVSPANQLLSSPFFWAALGIGAVLWLKD